MPLNYSSVIAMSKNKKEKIPRSEAVAEKKKNEKRDRLAVRLVENLRKRKLQARIRSGE